MPVIRFHFDYLSPYAYLAWTQIHALGAKYGHTVEAVPTLLAPLLNAGGQKGPAEIPAKRVWVWKDTLRTARRLGVPLSPPPNHPFNPLLALRVSGLVDDHDQQRRLIDALYRETWGGGGGVESPATVARLADEAGLDGQALLTRAAEPAGKDRLRLATDEALAAGVFGVPTMRVLDGQRDELFWGFDAFGHLETHLRGEDLFAPEDLARWQHISPSAVRKP